ncbi:MAG: class I SAM-dependent methyltransferase [Bdellovibrionota bacterium]
MPKQKLNKYFLYENSVQSPDQDVAWFASAYRDLFKKEPHALREDFCGTFAMSCEWVKAHPKNTALSLDLDPEPLRYGKEHHFERLKPFEKKRVVVLRKNVISVTSPKVDMVIAGNFSFFIFKKRQELVEYLRCCLRSLKPKGMVALEMAGGPGFVHKSREQKTIKLNGGVKYTYVWDQRKFNPITAEGLYAIHFRFPDGRLMQNVFTYDWRVWTVAEVREAMVEAGFKETHTYWESNYEHKVTGGYLRTEKGTNDWSWLAYVVGVKK